jgi:hypothetical protein
MLDRDVSRIRADRLREFVRERTEAAEIERRAAVENERPEAALEAYRGFLTMWADADPSLPPVVEARDAVDRLEG